MKLTDLQSVAVPGDPYASIALDVTRSDATAQHEVELRWRALRESLEAAGADTATVEALEGVALRPTGRGGRAGLVAVARDGEVLFERTVPQAPVRDEATWEALPHLMPLVRAVDGGARYVLVELDHAGADVTVVAAGAEDPAGDVLAETDSGSDHDEIHKIPGGGWSQQRYVNRVEDTWLHNARAVAQDLDRLQARFSAELVLVTGDTQARPLLLENLTQPVSEITQVIEAGSRHDDMSPGDGTVHPAVAQAVAAHVLARRRAGLEDLAEELGRDAAAVEGVDDVVDALRRAQVQEVFLADDPTATARLWVGPDAVTLGTRAQLQDMGVEQMYEVRADAAILAAVAATDAGITLIPGNDEDAGELAGIVPLIGGIAARLRYSDRSTPHVGLTAMTRENDDSDLDLDTRGVTGLI